MHAVVAKPRCPEAPRHEFSSQPRALGVDTTARCRTVPRSWSPAPAGPGLEAPAGDVTGPDRSEHTLADFRAGTTRNSQLSPVRG
jgi:hypothetical protein